MNENEQHELELAAHRNAVGRAIAMIAAAYPNKFNVGELGVNVWSDMLYDLDPNEVLSATATWISREKWPPSIAELRQMIPRLCRCGRCSACGRRKRERALGAGPGADLDTPLDSIDDARRSFFGLAGRVNGNKQLPRASETPRLNQ